LYCESCGRIDIEAKLRAKGKRGYVDKSLMVQEAKLAQLIEILGLPEGGLKPGHESRGSMRKMAETMAKDLGYTSEQLDKAIREHLKMELFYRCSDIDLERYDYVLRRVTAQLEGLQIRTLGTE
jgi:hypothetical protein